MMTRSVAPCRRKRCLRAAKHERRACATRVARRREKRTICGGPDQWPARWGPRQSRSLFYRPKRHLVDANNVAPRRQRRRAPVTTRRISHRGGCETKGTRVTEILFSKQIRRIPTNPRRLVRQPQTDRYRTPPSTRHHVWPVFPRRRAQCFPKGVLLLPSPLARRPFSSLTLRLCFALLASLALRLRPCFRVGRTSP